MLDLPFVLWPAPCAPALLAAGERRFDLLVLHAGDGADALATWASQLSLRAVDDGRRVPLALERVAPAPQELALRAADALALPDVARLERTQLRLAAVEPLAPCPPARSRCFDLMRGDERLRSRAVAARREAGGALAIAFATDLHLAAMWDALRDAVARHAPDLAHGFLDPAAHLARMVDALDARAARGELDALVLGGDLVDHVYRVPRRRVSGRADDSNVSLLVDGLARLRVPSFAIPGNHDFRATPWRPRSYGLDEIGIPRPRVRGLLRAAGLWDAWPLARADLDALRSREPSGRSALAQHLLHLAPRTDHAVAMGALELVFASTGRDLLPRWRALERARRGLLARALRTTWWWPDLEGLHDAQLAAVDAAFARAARAGRGAALFLHAPLLHPPERGRVEERVARLDPGPDDGFAARVAFERRLFASGLRRGVFFRNPAPLVRSLRERRAPIAVFSGHVHRAHAMTLARDGGALRSTSLVDAASGADDVAFVSGPALGQTDVLGEEQPGYLVARFADGRLAGVERCGVARIS